MRRFILTGAPGSGKTAIIRQLELEGFSVVEEAATDIIALWQARGVAAPWTHPAFIDTIAALQSQRQVRASHETGEVQFHDRSAICTAALAVYLGYPVSDTLSRELKRIATEAIYHLSERRLLHTASWLHHADHGTADQRGGGPAFRTRACRDLSSLRLYVHSHCTGKPVGPRGGDQALHSLGDKRLSTAQ